MSEPAAPRGQNRAPGGSVSATQQLPALDDRALAALRDVGREWEGSVPDRAVWERALPVDPQLTFTTDERVGRFLQIRTSGAEDAPELEVTRAATTPESRLGRAGALVRAVLIGPPLRSTAIAQERMRKLVALPVLSPDALSSVAYGPEAMLTILVLAGTAGLGLSLPISAAIVVLMLSIGLGYRQVIRAYPHGGGSYVVAKENLGPIWGLLAGAGLIVDYILTVAVSVASGVAAVTSAIPSLSSATVAIGLAVIAVLAVGNLRGVRDSAAAFGAPTYMFVLAIALIVIVGLVKSGEHGFPVMHPANLHATEAVTVLLVLRAFSSGATAMTGIEVISNAVPVFRPPEGDNARRTLTVMVALLISMFVGVVLLTHFYGTVPGGSETVLSKLAHATVGSGVLYGYVQVATALVLLVAANSAFNGFPRLLFFMACDGYAPRAFVRMGDRLAFTNGVAVLTIAAAIVYAGFGGNTISLIPLFAVGVFVAFTLSQTGMVVHWFRRRDKRWREAALTNLVGAVLSALVVLIAAFTKFLEGAWVVVVLVPLIVYVCLRIHRHYALARQALIPDPGRPHHRSIRAPRRSPVRADGDGRSEAADAPDEVTNFVIVPLAVLDLAALHALAYAASLSQPVLAVHVSPSEEEAERFNGYWSAWGSHLPLEVLVSPYRATVAPLANYIEALHRQRPDVTITVIVPEIIVRKPWQRILHNRMSARLRSALLAYPGIVITSVPFHLPA
jgi:amino acid transporter